ncbi:MAG: hypothetical protein AAFR87_23070 [Bacteroidota bacterium]
MEEQSYDIELADRYLSGKLGEEEKAAFEALMDSDEELTAYVKEILRAKATTHIAGREIWKKGMRGEFVANSSQRNKLLVAAIFILLIGIGGILWFQKNSAQNQEELFATQHEFVPAPEMRGEGIDSLLQDAYITYNLKNFPLAITKFDKILRMDSVPNRDDVHFFKAMALIEVGDLEGAREALEEVRGGRFLESAEQIFKDNK